MSPGGVAAGDFRHGRYSKYLPERLLGRYRDALADGELLELREEVALLDARLGEVLGRVDTGESGAVWKALRGAMAAYRQATAEGDASTAGARLAELQDLIERGTADEAVWAEIRGLIADRRRLVESERKRLVEMQQMITSEQAMVLLAAVVDTIRRHVGDRDTLAAISADIGRLVAIEARPIAGPGRG